MHEDTIHGGILNDISVSEDPPEPLSVKKQNVILEDLSGQRDP
jgi:hypothetical protein